LLLDYYIRRNFVHPEILQSVKDKPSPDYMEEGSWSSVLNSIKSNRSFQVEACMRLSLCLALAVGTYMHDLNKPKRLEMQKRRRDAQYAQFGPQPRYWPWRVLWGIEEWIYAVDKTSFLSPFIYRW